MFKNTRSHQVVCTGELIQILSQFPPDTEIQINGEDSLKVIEWQATEDGQHGIIEFVEGEDS